MKKVIYKKPYLNMFIRIFISNFLPVSIFFVLAFIFINPNLFTHFKTVIYIVLLITLITTTSTLMYIKTFKTYVYNVVYEDDKIIFNFTNWFSKQNQIIDLRVVTIHQGTDYMGQAGFLYLGFKEGKKNIFKMVADLGIISFTKSKDIKNLHAQIIDLQNQLKLQNEIDNQEDNAK